MARFERSGLSQVGFCSRHGLAFSTFQYWKRRLAKEPAVQARTKSTGDRSPSFLPVRVGAATPVAATILPAFPTVAVEMLLRSGRVLRTASDLDPHTLARLADALEDRPC